MVRIYKYGDHTDDNHSYYCRTENIPFMTGRTNVTIPMPNWDARRTGDGKYIIKANLQFGDYSYPDQDLEPRNDTNYTIVNLKFGDVFAYDPEQNPRNNVPDNQFTGIPGMGLDLFGFAYGGMGNIYGNSGGYDEVAYGAGYHGVGMSGSGQIAMKFTLYQRDTIYGYRAFFGSLNQAFEDISLAVYRDANGQPSSIRVPNTLIYKYRGFDDIRRDGFWDEYVTYELPAPVVLDAGSYWFAIGELGETGLELGASKSRMGMRTMSIYLKPPNFQAVNPVGEQGISLMIDKRFRRENNTGALINDNRFAYENTRGSGQWKQFMPTIGNPGYAHLHHFGLSNEDNYTLTLTRGTWIPMIRPYFGERSSGYDMTYDDCPRWPVELLSFDGICRDKGIELYWSTSTEINNDGFYIEKKLKESDEWKTMTVVKGARNSNMLNQYNTVDTDVEIGNTYDYRLRQIDFDGTLTCDDESPVISILYDGEHELTLEQSRPNPASQYTLISYSLPIESEVYVEILDIFGSKVRTLSSGMESSGERTIEWNLTDDAGKQVASGTYFCRLKAGNEVRTEKITVVR